MALSSLSPASAFAGTGPLSLSVNGVNFNAGSVVQWNGSMLATTFVSSSQLTTIAPASLTDTAGSPSITVVFGQVSSNAVALAVVAPYNVSPSPAMLTVAAPGGQASATITVTPATGFSGTVIFSCAVVYKERGNPNDAPRCSITPAQVSVVSPNNASATLSISSTAPHVGMALPNASGKQWTAFASTNTLSLAIVLAGIPWRQPSRRRQLRRIGWNAHLIAACLGLLMLPDCGGGGSNSGTNDPGTSQGRYLVTVNATAGAHTSSITVPVIVQ